MHSSVALSAASLVLLACISCVSCAPRTLGLATLILTIPPPPPDVNGLQQPPTSETAQTVLKAYGAPYSIQTLQSTDLNTLDLNTVLYDVNGGARFAFVIATPANVMNIFGGILNTTQINQIYAYQAAFGVRLALEAAYVPTVGSDIAYGPQGLGVALVNPDSPGTSVSTAQVASTAPISTSGIKAGATWDLTGLYGTPANIVNSSRSQAALTCTTPSSLAGGQLAVTTKFDDGREQFTTFFPLATFNGDAVLVVHMYYAWGMHGILPGQRDSLFSVQIDDLFLGTDEPFNTSAPAYRMTPADSKALTSFGANVPNLPPGSSFRFEAVYNTAGYIQATQNDAYFNVWADSAPADTLQTFQKPPGSGTSLMGLKPDLSWWKPATWRNDPLYNEIAFGSSGMLYFLGHHTFNHENLNNVTYWDALQQIRLNQLAAAPWNTTNGKFNRFSQTAMVTPAISGLRNVDALQALLDAGITAGVGDSSWPHLRNQANPWQAQLLSKNNNQTVDGFYIIPRSPTEVYYDVSTEAVEAQLYNWFYCCNSTSNANCPANGCEAGKPFTTPSSWSDILAREAARVKRLMFTLRPDGHMFHQANTRIDSGPSNQSLIKQWVSSVVAGYSSRVTWPLLSLKLDDQLVLAKKRIARDACGLDYKLTYDDVSRNASSLTITSTAGSGCDAPVMIASSAVTGANPNPRSLGSEPKLYTATLAAGQSKTLTLGGTIKWV